MEFESQLKEFDTLQSKLKSQIQETFGERAFLLKGPYWPKKNKDIALTIIGIIHGNEVAGLAVINEVLKQIVEKKIIVQAPIAFALGNIPAAQQNARFLEKDLNRVFGNNSTDSYEERRARELEPLLKRSDFVLDIHQTIEKTETPFFIFGFNPRSIQFAHYLDPQMPIINYSIQARQENGLVATAYAILKGAAAVTAELGQKGFAKPQLKHGVEMISKALKLVFESDGPMQEQYTAMELEPDESRTLLVFAHREPNEGDTTELHPGFYNFVPVKKGQILGQKPQGNIICPTDGKILFPKYGRAKWGSKELCVILEEHPYDWVKTTLG